MWMQLERVLIQQKYSKISQGFFHDIKISFLRFIPLKSIDWSQRVEMSVIGVVPQLLTVVK